MWGFLSFADKLNFDLHTQVFSVESPPAKALTGVGVGRRSAFSAPKL